MSIRSLDSEHFEHTITRAQYAASLPAPRPRPEPRQPLEPVAEPDDRAWMADANCKGRHDVMYPPPLTGTRVNPGESHALAICALCDVRAECLAWALDHEEVYGVWGGTTERERRRMLGRYQRNRRKATA